jgi:hypothetical protein
VYFWPVIIHIHNLLMQSKKVINQQNYWKMWLDNLAEYVRIN